MTKRNLPLNRTLALGFGAFCAACGGGSDELGGNNGRLTADQADVVECEEGREPVVTANTIALWPPNHKLHTIDLNDCVSLSCGAPGSASFLYATSDEPVDDIGDGHHSPDIGIDEAGNVCVRAERQGPKNGRVYHLGVQLDDGTVSECTIIVDHDQRGVEGQDDGEAYRVTFDGTATELAACDPVEVPPGDGDGDGDEGDGDGDGDVGDGDGDVGDGDGDGDADAGVPPVDPGDGDGDGDGPVVQPL
jgi:hypothetical protein